MSTEEKIRQLPPLPDRESFFASLRRSFDEAGLGELLTQEAEERFYILLGYMLDEGSRLNVTAIRSIDEIIAKHFTDSAAVAPYLPQGCAVCDVGTGGGFPALPLVCVGGSFIAMKGPSGREELAASGSAIEKLGGAFSAEHETIIRLGEEHLCHPLFVIEKCGHTPTQYPRQFSKIAKRPL